LILNILFYIAYFLLIIIIPLEILSYNKTKKRIFNCLRRNITRRTKKRLLSDIELLFKEVSFLSSDQIIKLRLHVESLHEESYISKMFNTLLSMLAVLLAITALISSWTDLSSISSMISQLNLTANFFLEMARLVAIMFITINIHNIVAYNEKKFKNKFTTVIHEIEKKQPVIVHLSEDQYQALSASSGLQRTVYRFGRSENP